MKKIPLNAGFFNITLNYFFEDFLTAFFGAAFLATAFFAVLSAVLLSAGLAGSAFKPFLISLYSITPQKQATTAPKAEIKPDNTPSEKATKNTIATIKMTVATMFLDKIFKIFSKVFILSSFSFGRFYYIIIQ